MKGLKITGIVLAIVYALGCIGINSWYLWIKFYGPEKIVSPTFEVGLQEIADGTTAYFVEVNSYDDCYELKFNYMLDENQEAFYSQGLQYFADGSVISFKEDHNDELVAYEHGFLGYLTKKYNREYYYRVDSTVNRLNYMSSDNYVNAPISTNPIDLDTLFKIQIGKDLYGMRFKGKEAISDSYTKIDSGWMVQVLSKDFIVYDVDYFAALLYDGISTLPYGTNKAMAFEFGDLFDYYQYDETNMVYSKDKVDIDKASLIEADIKSYYSIKVTKHEGNIQKASDSLFNCVNGSPSYNVSGVESEDYFYGKTTITANNSAFKMVEVTENVVAFKLKEDFIDTFDDYNNKIQLQVLIDLDELNTLGLEFVGFTADSGLDVFEVISCQTVETVDGQLVYTEVSHD